MHTRKRGKVERALILRDANPGLSHLHQLKAMSDLSQRAKVQAG